MKTGTEFNRYVIEKNLSNSGGTAGVYLAHLVNDTQKKVAIKVAYTGSKGKSHEDFLLEKESDLLQKWDFRHPGIVRIFPSPLLGGKPQYSLRAIDLPNEPTYLVMEYLRGDSVGQKLKTMQKFSLNWKLELFYQILVTVSFMHSKGYAHRDLKPDNIVFREPISPDQVPMPVLIDFALSTDGKNIYDVIDNSLTPQYSPPERIAKSDGVDVKIDYFAQDIWSLGIILHEIITGEIMIKGNSEKVKTTIIKERIEPALPDGTDFQILASIIRAMIDPDLDKRPTIDLVMKAFDNKFLPPLMS